MSPVLTPLFAGLLAALVSSHFASAATTRGLAHRTPARASRPLTEVSVRHVTFPRRSVEARDSTTIPVAPFAARFVGKVPKRQAQKDILRGLRSAASNTTVVVDGSDFDEEYITEFTVGNQTFLGIVDTGSSDTWLVETGFLCVNSSGNPIPEDDCDFGPTFDPSTSTTFVDFPDHNFNISYGDGEFLNGPVGFDTVSIGNLTVTNQTLPLANYSYWFGDGISSGLIGLAYPDLTSVYNGTDASADKWFKNSDFYNPFFHTAVAEGVVSEPYFSVALNRGSFEAEENSTFDANLGYLGLGGIAPVAVTNTSTTLPIQGYSVSTFLPSNNTNSSNFAYLYYTIDIQASSFDGSERLGDTSLDDIILDTGTTLNYLPTNVANLFASKFDPPATYSDDEGAYVVDCNATGPVMSVRINSVDFTIDTADQILPIGTDDDGNEVCILGTDDGGANEDGNIFILGDTFLHNVVATFNINTNEVTLTQRESY